ncbi:MAG: hypothetical protein M3N34_10535 [Pseudomonadota bacterium]|nr:hypothetical protein [Pseudomonadota bacterium]
MIFVTVGTQVHFDRLVRAVDEWAVAHGRDDIIAQVGTARYQPRALQTFNFLDPASFAATQRDSTLMVAHAGLGSIISALQIGKPIIIMPRDHRRYEHRNGHQFTTVEQFRSWPGVYVAMDEAELVALLDRADELVPGPLEGAEAPIEFINQLDTYLRTEHRKSPLRRLLRSLWRRQPSEDMIFQ